MKRKVLIPIQNDFKSEVSNHQNILNWVTGLNGRQFTLQIRKGGSLESMNGPAGSYPEGQLNAVKDMIEQGYRKAGFRYMSWSKTGDEWKLEGIHEDRQKRDGATVLALIEFRNQSSIKKSSKWLADQLADPEVLEDMQNLFDGLGSLFG